MKKVVKIIAVISFILVLCIIAMNFTSCREADVVSSNVSKEADAFKVCRKITVINSRTDTIIYELQGIFSINNNLNNELEIICKTGENEYKKHFIYLTDTVLYIVEDLQGADVSSYQYNVTIYPQRLVNGIVDFEVDN